MQTPLNVAILYAVGEVLIPIDPCVAALAGVRALEDLVQTVSGFRQEFTDAGPLVISGVLITRTDRTLVSKQIEAEVRNYFGPLVYDRVIPSSVKFREAYARGTPLIRYDRFSAGAEGYRAAARAFLGQAEPPAVAVGVVATPGAVRDDGLWNEEETERDTCRAGRGGMTDEWRGTTRGDTWSGEPDRPCTAGHDRGRVRAADSARPQRSQRWYRAACRQPTKRSSRLR